MSLQAKVVQWYHHYLMHPGHTRLEETIAATMYWRFLWSNIRSYVKRCADSQRCKKRKRKYGKLPSKIVEIIPWQGVCVDLTGLYTLKAKDGTILDFMCVTMVDPATGWFEIVDLPLVSVQYTQKGEEIIEIVTDKSSAEISRLFDKQWLSRYLSISQIKLCDI